MGNCNNCIARCCAEMSRMIISGLEHSSRSGADNLRTAGERFSTNDSGFGRYNHMEVTTDSKDIVPGYLIRNKYQVIGILGEGTFGKVFKAYDKRAASYVAIKVNKEECATVLDGEIYTLRRLKGLDPLDQFHIVEMFSHFYDRGRRMMVCELLDMNLKKFISRMGETIPGVSKKGLPLGLTKNISHQILLALDFLGKNKLMHCDVKPENIMVKMAPQPQVKLIDFGCARVCLKNNGGIKLQTRYYRAVEVVLECPEYSEKIDVWSLGCIMAEVYVGQVLFNAPSDNNIICSIASILGPVPATLMQQGNKGELFQRILSSAMPEPPQRYRSDCQLKYPQALKTFLTKEKHRAAQAHGTALEDEKKLICVISKMLKYDYNERISTSQIFDEQFFTNMKAILQ